MLFTGGQRKTICYSMAIHQWNQDLVTINKYPAASSTDVLSGYINRSWRFLAELQQSSEMEFVIGEAQGPYLWNIERTHRLLDCGNAGGVHSLGHRNSELLATLHAAFDRYDAGIWSMPTAESLMLQDALTTMAPTTSLCRSVTTLSSTDSIDLALMFAMRCTGRKTLVAYRHGYHGHGGMAALVTGSDYDGQLEHYSLSRSQTRFFDEYDSAASVTRQLDGECAALILELMNFETFKPASPEFLQEIAADCRRKGILFIVDETRTGLGRSGLPWLTSHYALAPDIIVLGKGLGGGLYPVSALVTTQPIYDRCLNEGHWGFSSSMAGSPVASLVAAKVVEIIQRPDLVANVKNLETLLTREFAALCDEFPAVFAPGSVLGAIATIGLRSPAAHATIQAALFKRGVMCHSISLIEPTVVKFFPCLTSEAGVVTELAGALRAFAADLR
jgi:putrescine aminotransferase